MIDLLMPLLGKYDKLKTSYDTHANSTSAHSATASPTANRMVLRDGNGRAQFADPAAAADAATRGWVLSQIGGINVGVTALVPGGGINITNPNGPLVTVGLSNTGVSAGTYNNPSLTVDAQGRITSISSGSVGLTGLSVEGPLQSTGGSNPTISLPAATASTPGHMTATDKAKLNGIDGTASATANAYVKRDSNGRASFADPTSSSHAATRGWVLGLRPGSFSGYTVSTSGPSGSGHQNGDLWLQV